MSIEKRSDGTEVDLCRVECKGHGRIWVSHCRECAGLPPEPKPTMEEILTAVGGLSDKPKA